MIRRLRGKENLINLAFILMGLLGGYLILAWASYSPLDNAWSVASTATEAKPLNKMGAFGAWSIDLLYAFFGKVAFLIPFVMAGVSVYALIARVAPMLTFKQVLLRFCSFIIFMLGTAGLANALFDNTPNYLSGGFIGGIWHTLLSESLGQFGSLSLAMFLASVGFYFCSGQTIIALLTDFYEWIIAKDEKQADESDELLQNNEEISPLVVEVNDIDDEEPLPSDYSRDENLTDLSVFKRPHISGLRTTEEAAVYSEHSEQESYNSPMYEVEPSLDLPKVNVQGFELPIAQSAITTEIEQGVEATPELPQIRLNPYANETIGTENKLPITMDNNLFDPMQIHLSSPPVTEEIGEKRENAERTEGDDEQVVEEESALPAFMQNVQPTVVNPVVKMPVFEAINDDDSEDGFESQRAREFAEMEQAKLAAVKARAEAAGLEQIFNNLTKGSDNFATNIAAQVKVRTEPTPSVFQTNIKPAIPVENEPTAPSYPNGYGETFIHPLLQKKKVMEKPTTPLPTLDLLKNRPTSNQQMTEEEILATSRRIEAALANYGVKATVEDVLVGPVVTRYEIKPAAGVKAAKVSSLANDLGRELTNKVRITEVVPGKPYMGIEMPNRHRETVWLREVLASDAFKNSKAILPMALGKDISGQPMVVDMAKMPHLLVAGQTGGGKSVGVNTMILSLLFKLSPEQVRFIMIDPKVVELSVYNDIPHLLTPVVTDMKKAANALRWAVEEMERRYILVSHLGVRNIEGYNAKIDQAAEMKMPIPNPMWKPGDTMDQLPPVLEKLTYIVLIVDEFADLMMTAGKEVEDHIMRIAQKARAVGIHLILATQRPSTDVITGTIKANIPSRIAFTVATGIDSRTILDAGGAEALLGRGDMLYSGAGSPDILRVHGAFMEDDEVNRVADNWRARGKPNYLDSITASAETEGAARDDDGSGELDPLFDEIVEFVVESGITSISGIQRRFSLGFTRAARIVDQMAAQGILSEAGKNGKREVLAR